MLREIVSIVVPLGLPALLVFLWRIATGRTGLPMPWLRCLGVGVVLMAVTLTVLASYDKEEPGGKYRPAHIDNGRIVPGGIQREPAR